MMKLFVALLALAVAANSMRVRRIPSKIETMLRSGQVLANTQNETDLYNTEYIGQVDIGTPAQTMNVILDTGSSDLWVHGPNYILGAAHKFDPSRSSTFQKVSGSFSIQYGSGSATGTLGQDVVGFTGTSFSYKNQVFGLATQGQATSAANMDGICGMSFPSIAAIKVNGKANPDPWNNIINGPNAPSMSWFTVWLEEDPGIPQGAVGGEFTFGDYDKQHCSSSCTWVKLSHNLWYEFNVDSVGAGSYKSGSASAISDTGTSFLIGPPRVISSIAEQLGGRSSSNGLYSINCNNPPSKTIDVYINGKNYAIQSKNYIFKQAANQCYLAMQGAVMGNPQWILGDTWIRSWCNSYDMKNGGRVGLCAAN